MEELKIGDKVIDTNTSEIGTIKNMTSDKSIAFVIGLDGNHWTCDTDKLKLCDPEWTPDETYNNGEIIAVLHGGEKVVVKVDWCEENGMVFAKDANGNDCHFYNEKTRRATSAEIEWFNNNERKVDVRSHNVGASDYAKHKIQPWDIWIEYHLNPWDADIVKRVLRHKDGETRRLDYEKIIHICQERIRQIDNNIVVD